MSSIRKRQEKKRQRLVDLIASNLGGNWRAEKRGPMWLYVCEDGREVWHCCRPVDLYQRNRWFKYYALVDDNQNPLLFLPMGEFTV